MRKLLWFVGLYGASIAVFALVALTLRSLLR
jgi:cellobiose-specific phosphotransferase system component IIC